MTQCPICVENFNKKIHRPVTCFHCENTICMKCTRRFILETVSDAKCMFCNIKWDRRFMVNNLTKSFCDNVYRKHRYQILYERCKCQLASITPIFHLKHQQEILQKEYVNLVFQRRSINQSIHDLEKNVSTIVKKIRQLEHQFIRQQNVELTDHEEEKQRPCITTNCLGFVNSNGFCPMCKQTVCLTCNVHVDPTTTHECKEEDKILWDNLKKTTKQCPSCRVRIFKITGCDQMWCTHCNTAFSWSRGTIERGTVHNPHYFDWLFHGNNDTTVHEPNMNCNENELPTSFQLKHFLNKNPVHFSYIVTRYRILTHLKEVEIPILRGMYFNPDEFTTEEIYRKQLLPFLYGIAKNKENIRKDLEKFDYQFMCNIECIQIVETYVRQQTHLFHSLLNKTIVNETFFTIFEKTKQFYLEALGRFEKEYKRKYNKIKSRL